MHEELDQVGLISRSRLTAMPQYNLTWFGVGSLRKEFLKIACYRILVLGISLVCLLCLFWPESSQVIETTIMAASDQEIVVNMSPDVSAAME